MIKFYCGAKSYKAHEYNNESAMNVSAPEHKTVINGVVTKEVITTQAAPVEEPTNSVVVTDNAPEANSDVLSTSVVPDTKEEVVTTQKKRGRKKSAE